jgi:PAP2 superfamily
MAGEDVPWLELRHAPFLPERAAGCSARLTGAVHGRTYTRRAVRTSTVLRAAAWGVVATGVAVPIVRRRLKIPPLAVTAAAGAAPLALCVATRRSRLRDATVCALQMWAYIATYEMPNDDPERLRARVRVDYPVRLDRALGLGELPGVRLQRAFGRPGKPLRGAEQVLVWAHWLWFLVPHGSVGYLLLRRRELFPRGALMVYAVFDLGVIGYWALPTAPPWYAARLGAIDTEDEAAIRRMMSEHGEVFWKSAWGPLYDVLGGNPLAAMPSLHFGTSVMAAHVLSDAGAVEGALAWTYAVTLGFALVYLGEHYVVDLLAGLALTEAVRSVGPRAAPALRAVGRAVQALERAAHA